MVSQDSGGQDWGRGRVVSQATGGQVWEEDGLEGALGTQPSPGLLFVWSLTHPIVKLPFVHALK